MHPREYEWFLAKWAQRLSWQETGVVFLTRWQSVLRGVKHAVFWGIVHDVWRDVRPLGVDEIAWRKGHSYLTMVYQLGEDRKPRLWGGQEREKETLERFCHCLRPEQSSQVDFACSDRGCADVAV